MNHSLVGRSEEQTCIGHNSTDINLTVLTNVLMYIVLNVNIIGSKMLMSLPESNQIEHHYIPVGINTPSYRNTRFGSIVVSL